MTTFLKCASFVLLASASWAVNAQTLPADTGTPAPGVGFSLPTVGGTLSYALNGSELISSGFFNDTGVTYTTSLSGDLAYVSKSQSHPFSAVYDGGVLVANSGQPNTVFQSLSFSQVLNTKRWNITVADQVSYLPESPVGGLSGVPGVGDLGIDPIQVGTSSGIGILTTYGPRVSNSVSGSVGRQITGRISAQFSGDFSVQRFLGDNSQLALDNTSEGVSGGLSYRMSARDTFNGSYNYSNFSYSGLPYSFSTQGATLQYSRQWSPRLVTTVYAGPQIAGGSNPLFSGSSVNIAAGASASYLSRTTSYSVAYSRGINNGSGVIQGALSDSIIASAHRQFGRIWAVSGNVGYSHNASLPNFDLYNFDSNAVTFGGEVSRGLGRYFAAQASYTLEDQIIETPAGQAVAQNAFSGFYQVFAIGISYSPRNIRLNK